jgi:hypothetical protein
MLIIAVGLTGVATAWAQKDDRKSADLQVWTIRATTKNSEISPELRTIAEQLKKQFKYTGFKLERRATGHADLGKAFSTALVGDYQARITPQKHDGRRVTLQVEVLKGDQRQYNATVTLEAGKFQLQGGWALEGGDALIVAVAAR